MNASGRVRSYETPINAGAAAAPLLLGLFVLIGLGGCAAPTASTGPVVPTPPSPVAKAPLPDAICKSGNTVIAEVVALDQVYYYNRFGSFNPAGMIYALRRDVVKTDPDEGMEVKGDPAIDATSGGEVEQAIPVFDAAHPEVDLALAGKVKLRRDKRARPLVLRVNEGDCLRVTFTNLINPFVDNQEIIRDPLTRFKNDKKKRLDAIVDTEEPATRTAGMHVNGLDYGFMTGESFADADGNMRLASDGANIGRNLSSLAVPGQTRVYTWYAKKEGGYLMYSMGAAAGGEGDGGQISLGLFGSVNVQPKGAKWYRSQVDHDDLMAARDLRKSPTGTSALGHPILDYDSTFKSRTYQGEPLPILSMLQHREGAQGGVNEIVYADLNAVIDITDEADCELMGEGNACGKPYREFTTVFHDEITAVQAFEELKHEEFPASALRDGMAINYGAAGLGSMVMAAQQKIGPAKDCVECKLEEFFLASWANGDPALILKYDENKQNPVALYPDDPSNVHHSYIGDAIRFRNMHAGPKETHVFHLHAHQWVQDKHDPSSVYLDSQTISPGAVFSYEIHYGGSGNRNFTVGDSIFHCHLYPHFAQGMWELWRSHDIFEDGTPGLYAKGSNPGGRNLPDGEIYAGTPNPAIVPLPRTALAPMPSDEFRGYPFYIAGQAGHRPPQAPKDLDDTPNDKTLQRHRIASGRLATKDIVPQEMVRAPAGDSCAPDATPDLYDRGRKNSACIAGLVNKLDHDPNFFSLARKLEAAQIESLPLDGTPEEQRAMAYHQGLKGPRGERAVGKGDPGYQPTAYNFEARGYPTCDSQGNCDAPTGRRMLFHVNGHGPKPGAPYADPCPDNYLDAAGNPHKVQLREYRAAYIQFDMPVNKAGWHDPQARIAVLEQDVLGTFNGTRPAEPLFFRAKSGECVVFKGTNLVPSNLNLDDFQVYSPTDTIGQHIHLVKFDVTASDGSGNGWNYEDGTLAADELRERMAAHNRWVAECKAGKHEAKECTDLRLLQPMTHAMFKPGHPRALSVGMAGDARGVCPDTFDASEWEKHPWCGAQTTVQRWWADPLLNRRPGEDGATDRTIRTVFTHDHFGPSSHQHHGLYAALLVEPTRSKWDFPDGQTMGGSTPDGRPATGIKDPWSGNSRVDGGPTHYAANLTVKRIGAACVAGYDPAVNPECVDAPEHIDASLSGREFNLAFADYAIVYDANNRPVNAPNRIEGELPFVSFHSRTPAPEGISTKDPGTQLINYRNEPIPLRIGELKNRVYQQKADKDQADLANVFSSDVHRYQGELGAGLFRGPVGAGRQPGDPATPLMRAYEGDRVQIRLIQGAQEENHIFNMHGVKWLSQPHSANSGYSSAQPIGISEHFEFDVNLTAPSQKVPTDYLYSSTATDNLWDGQWGLLRAYPSTVSQPGLAPLPSNPPGLRPVVAAKAGVCPKGANPVGFVVEAQFAKDLLHDGALVYNRHFGLSDANAMLFYLDTDEADLRSGAKDPEPLILRANAGDCITVTLKNRLSELHDGAGFENKASWSYNTLPQITDDFNFNQITMSGRISLHPQLVAVKTWEDDGARVGNNPDSTVAPGMTFKYTWYAGDLEYDSKGWPKHKPIEFGAIPLRDMADVIKHPSHGAIGALVIEPRGATVVTDCEQLKRDGKSAEHCLNAAATVTTPDGKSFREFVLLYQDDISLQQFGQPVPNLRNGDDAEDSGQKGFNYRTEPLWARLGASPADSFEDMQERDWSNVFSSRTSHAACTADPKKGRFCDPATPLFTAEAGMQVRFRVVHPGGHPRNHAFSLFGHDWTINPWTQNSTVMGWNRESSNRVGTTNGIGPGRHVNIVTTAGGCMKVPGDYLYRTQEGFALAGGEWGIFRVTPQSKQHPLPDTCRTTP